MKLRNVVWLTIFNIFLLLLWDVWEEYDSLWGRLKKMQETTETAFTCALDTSMATEETFTSALNGTLLADKLYSKGDEAQMQAHLLFFRDGQWLSLNPYACGIAYRNQGNHAVIDVSACKAEDSAMRAESDNKGGALGYVFKNLYGEVGEDYTSPALEWSSRNYGMYEDLKSNSYVYNHSREAKTYFENFAKTVGYKVNYKTNVKHKDASDPEETRFEVVQQSLPSLLQMGLQYHSGTWGTYNLATYGASTGGVSSAMYVNDNFVVSYHVGKKLVGGGAAVDKSLYFLTPQALGVTYIDPYVLKACFQSYIEEIVRFNKVKYNKPSFTLNSEGSVGAASSAFAGVDTADGCIPTTVYDMGGSVAQKHVNNAGDVIVNDGEVEYNLSSMKVRVDYYAVDMYSSAKRTVANTILGYKAGAANSTDTSTMDGVVHDYQASDSTTSNGGSDGMRIVARCSFKIKVNIPYKSAMLQWFEYMTTPAGQNNHYGVRMMNPDGTANDSKDGVWFEFTTYRAVVR